MMKLILSILTRIFNAAAFILLVKSLIDIFLHILRWLRARQSKRKEQALAPQITPVPVPAPPSRDSSPYPPYQP